MKKKCNKSIVIMILLSMILPMFFRMNVLADETVLDTFYVLDENGNLEKIEITKSSLASSSEKEKNNGVAVVDEEGETDSTTDSTTENVIGIVRFSKEASTFDYIETDTGREGYMSPFSAGEAAYIGTQEEGVICYIGGARILVDPSIAVEITSYKDQEISYYYCSNGYLIHRYVYYNSERELKKSSTRVGFAPSYLQEGVNYYSYDGHYFYESFEVMIEDYKNNVYDNAVNASTPHYNYYQYLSFHTTAPFTGEEYNTYVASKDNKENSVMLTTGDDFVNNQNWYTINGVLMFGVAINESGWGTSDIARNKNNLFGLHAYDSSPSESSSTYESTQACIEDFAYGWLHTGYLDGGDYRYRGPHLGDKHSGINVCYASDPYWGEKAASQVYYFDTEKEDYGRYTIGIAASGNIKLYKEADTSSASIYTSEAGTGGDLFDYPVLILGTETNEDGDVFYKIVSDMSLKGDRSARDVEAIYKPSRDYVYAEQEDIQIVFEGTGENIIIPDPVEKPEEPEQPVEGWKEIDGNQYYCKADGSYATGWYNVEGKDYYFDKDGIMQTGWLQDGDKWYYLDSTGAMKTGWLQKNENWYYFDTLGVMKTGWLLNSGSWYYFDTQGVMKTGWLFNNGNWYYFDSTGAMKTGWLLSDGNWYYFDSTGAMATDQWIGDSYVDRNGIWISEKVK